MDQIQKFVLNNYQKRKLKNIYELELIENISKNSSQIEKILNKQAKKSIIKRNMERSNLYMPVPIIINSPKNNSYKKNSTKMNISDKKPDNLENKDKKPIDLNLRMKNKIINYYFLNKFFDFKLVKYLINENIINETMINEEEEISEEYFAIKVYFKNK